MASEGVWNCKEWWMVWVLMDHGSWFLLKIVLIKTSSCLRAIKLSNGRGHVYCVSSSRPSCATGIYQKHVEVHLHAQYQPVTQESKLRRFQVPHESGYIICQTYFPRVVQQQHKVPRRLRKACQNSHRAATRAIQRLKVPRGLRERYQSSHCPTTREIRHSQSHERVAREHIRCSQNTACTTKNEHWKCEKECLN